jgi:PAS domain S-box-containing protein
VKSTLPADFQLVFNSLPGLFVLVCADTPEFTIAGVSDEYLHATRMSREELEGHGFFEMFGPAQAESANELRASFARVLETRQVDTMPVGHGNLPSGSPGGEELEQRYWEPVNSPVPGADGGVEFILYSLEDRSEVVAARQAEAEERRRAAEKQVRLDQATTELFLRSKKESEVARTSAALQDSADRYHDLAELVSDGIFVTDSQGHYTDANDAACRMLGYTLDELTRLSVSDVIVPEELARLPEQFRNLATGAIVKSEWKFRRKDGSTFIGELVARQFPGERLQGIVRDVTERRHAEDQLRESEAAIRALFNSAPQGVALLNESGRILMANPTAARLFGYEQGEMLGLQIGTLLPELVPDAGTAVSPIRALLSRERRGERNLETTARRKGGSGFVAEVSASEFEATSGVKLVIFFISDITQRKHTEEALEVSEIRQAYLLRLSDALRPLSDPVEIQTTASRILGEQIGANRVMYAGIFEDGTVEVGRDWVSGVPSAAGRFNLDVYGEEAAAALRRGENVLISDVAIDARFTEKARQALQGLGFAAGMEKPLVKRGKLIAIFGVHSATPRVWTDLEIALMNETAERTWEAVERAKAEAAVREDEARQAYLLKLADSLRPLSDPREIQETASRVLGEQLRANRVVYSDIDDESGIAGIGPNYLDGAPSLTGEVPMERFGPEVVAALRRGQTVILNDINSDPSLSGQERQMYEALKAAAGIAEPLIKRGRWVAVLVVTSGTPRTWTPFEITLLRETAQRTWSAVRRAQAEAALRESEEKYRSLFESIDQGFLLCELARDEKGRVVDAVYLEVNRAFEKMTGVAASVAIGRTFTAVSPDLARDCIPALARVADTKDPMQLEVSAHGKQFELHVTPRGGDRFAILCNDITERKRTEAALRQNQERQAFLLKLSDALRQLTDASQIQRTASCLLGPHLDADRVLSGTLVPEEGIARVGPDYFRSGLATLEGQHLIESLMPEALCSERPVAIADTETSPLLSGQTRARLAGMDIRALICVPVVREGKHVWSRIVGASHPRQWKADEVALIQEVTERVWYAMERARAVTALRESEERFRALTTASVTSVFSLNADWTEFRLLTSRDGVKRPVEPARDWLERYVPPEERDLVMRTAREAIRDEKMFELEHRVLRRNGTQGWAHTRAVPLRNSEGKIVEWFGTATDVTARKSAEEELQRRNVELTKLNQELEEFAYVASHDLQEPLRMVNIYTQLLLRQDGLKNNPQAAKFAEFVRKGVYRMEALIQDLLLYSRVIHPEQEAGTALHLDRALDDAIGMLKVVIDESHAELVRHPLPIVWGDERQLSLVFQNLISNAIKYGRKDGTPRVEIFAEPRGDDWVVSVRDNGIGFDPRYAERIFGLFRRLHKEAYPGTGLGLAIAKRIIERYGGRIWAESAGEGQGAVFSFSLRQV